MAALLVFPTRAARTLFKAQMQPKIGLLWQQALLAAMVLAGPALSVAVAGQFLNANDTTLAFALCPATIAVVASVTGEANNADLTGLLWPGLAGVAGLLLLLPEPAFVSVRPWLGLAVLPLVEGIAAGVWVQRLRGNRASLSGEFRIGLAAGLASSAAAFALLAALNWCKGEKPDFSLSAAVLDGLTAGLTLLSLGQLGAIRWSAQFLLIPLLGLLEGALLLRPFLDWRSYMALGLLGVSGAYQWMARPQATPTGPEPVADLPVPEA